MTDARRFFAAQAWVAGEWAQDVLLATGADGLWSRVLVGCSDADRVGAEVLDGPVLPGLVDAHGHAFQRAIAGLTECAAPGRDDFWSWRDRMYAAAGRIGPQQLETIAVFLYTELLRAGYTQVCEFHYLHNDVDGHPYADPHEMSLALVRAAQRTGIGLTLLPTLYMRSGFGAKGLREDQRRFASTPESVLRIAEAVRQAGSGGHTITAGIALHSLRAVDEGALREAAAAARQGGMPVHIHIAEQQLEVDDCLQRHGQRPIEWLLANVAVDPHWSLVHATRNTPGELAKARASDASIVICPSTEANLGDGTFDLPAWLAIGGRWSIGSDSHITRSPIEELRLLEYSQRLALRQRNVAARAAGCHSTAGVLFDGALAGGSTAAGQPCGGLAVGQRADFCVLDRHAPALAGIPSQRLLDALVFSSPETAMQRVCVAGREVNVRPQTREFAALMRALW
jgi:formimidoylglutamate deiminase